MRKPLLFIPKAIPFSQIEAGGEDPEEPIEFGVDDPNIEQPLQRESFLFVLKALPKDRYRVIALMLYLRDELGFELTYEDIGQIFGTSKVNVFNHIKRMRRTLAEAGVRKEAG